MWNVLCAVLGFLCFVKYGESIDIKICSIIDSRMIKIDGLTYLKSFTKSGEKPFVKGMFGSCISNSLMSYFHICI